ncbi:dinuclear metal center protein, YbgI/SA1388 family [Salibacterium halotolerans]|uniref:GTP cyclohydrolase 1 type 2 homolog n=2 Tax=Salibacterium halotolerans TaxID=1884432 RepID=A0A1I5NIX8_9BACI|nr:Nif3-like dinuclear metal center hexameric protein [Salibacterium halotolerans]SFP21286.1 dinuclear metal center protein, YbgI/SA1388 family [Salibacterium halotolerans]
MKTADGRMIAEIFEGWAPRSLALEKDNVGLMVGTLNKPVHRVLTTLDVSNEVVDEAVEKDIDLIIAHHPLIFKPMASIETSGGKGSIIEKCMKHDIAVYAAHTNLDIADGGVNDMLADALGLEKTEVLVPMTEVPLKKLTAFVPEGHVESVRSALGDAGAGHIGDYSHCTFSTDGTGTFIPGDNTDPYLGTRGQMEFAPETRMETIVPETILPDVIKVLESAHPYEEPAYDVYPLDIQGEVMGLGRIGYLSESHSYEGFIEHVKSAFGVRHVRTAGPEPSEVRTVAVLGGDGNKFWSHALKRGADVYITGDLYFHTAQDAALEGLNTIDPGHHIEQIIKEGVRRKMESLIDISVYDITFYASTISTEPFTFR